MRNIKIIHFGVVIVYTALSSHAWSPTNTFAGSIDGVSLKTRRQWQPSRVCPTREVSTLMRISEQQLGTFEVIETTKAPSERQVALLDYTTDSSLLIDFDTAWGHQREILDDQMERLSLTNGKGKTSNDYETSSFLPTSDEDDEGAKTGHRDTIIMLQHHPVYTLGTGSDEKFVKASLPTSDDSDDSADSLIPSVPVVRMDRGGEVTYHGPGQITVYPVLDLRSYRQDIHWYMRALEEAIILAISKCSTTTKPLRAEREDGVTGV